MRLKEIRHSKLKLYFATIKVGNTIFNAYVSSDSPVGARSALVCTYGKGSIRSIHQIVG